MDEGVGVAEAREEGGPPAWRRHTAVVSTGLACGLLFYRYAVLPFATGGTRARLLLGVAIGLASAARSLRRRGALRASPFTPAKIALGLASAGVAAGLAFLAVPPLGYVSLRPRALPGFDIELPSGDEDASNASGTSDGQLVVQKVAGTGAGVQVTWHNEARYEDDELRAMITTAAIGLGDPTPGVRTDLRVFVPRNPTRRTLADDRGHVWLTALSCGSRGIFFVTASLHGGVERLHRRVAATITCRDVPVTPDDDVPLAMDSEATWYRLPGPRHGQLWLASAAGALVVQRTFGTQLDEGMEAMAKAQVVPGFVLGERVGDRWRVEIPTEGKRVRGWAQMRACPGRHLGLLLIWAPLKASDSDDGSVLDHARCLGEGEHAQTWPAAPTPAH